jgi:hypothetical protein
MTIVDSWICLGEGRIIEVARTVGNGFLASALVGGDSDNPCSYSHAKGETVALALVALEARLRTEAEALVTGQASALDSVEVNDCEPTEMHDEAAALGWLEGELGDDDDDDELVEVDELTAELAAADVEPARKNGKPRRARKAPPVPPEAEDQG